MDCAPPLLNSAELAGLSEQQPRRVSDIQTLVQPTRYESQKVKHSRVHISDARRAASRDCTAAAGTRVILRLWGLGAVARPLHARSLLPNTCLLFTGGMS